MVTTVVGCEERGGEEGGGPRGIFTADDISGDPMPDQVTDTTGDSLWFSVQEAGRSYMP